MAWETRSGRRYYYRSKRTGNRIQKTYLGAGEVAKQAAGKDATAKAKQLAAKAELAGLQAKLAGVDQLAAEAQHGLELLVQATLLGIGYRKRRGEWRRPRHESEAQS
jgi:hypothetical protein